MTLELISELLNFMEQPQEKKEDADITYIKSMISAHEDFPKKGIVFRDLFPVLRDPKGFEMIINRMCNYVQKKYGDKVSVICGLDSRGFLFGPIMALRLKCSFVPIRKKGKLPGKCISQSFEKEYGGDTLEIQSEAIKKGAALIIVDDLLATGGTLEAAYKLLTDKQIEANVLDSVVVIELDGLKGSERLNKLGLNVHSLIHY